MAKVFKVEIVKNLEGSPARDEWRNTYHIELTPDEEGGDYGGAGIASDGIVEDVNRLANGERNMHLQNVRILRAVISTPEEGDQNDPKSVRIIPYNFLGLRPIPVDQEPLPLTQVLRISFAARIGRAGMNQYRGVLLDGDVQLNEGAYQLPQPKAEELLNDLMAGVYLRNLQNRLRVVSVRAGVVSSRVVASITVVGVSSRQRTQKKRGKGSSKVSSAGARVGKAVGELLGAKAAIDLARALNPESPAVISAMAAYNQKIALIPTFGILP